VVPEALAGALAVSAGASQSASLTCLQAWADVIAVSLVSKEVPLNASTPMQQNFLDQVTQKIGTIQPTPRLNRRRAKGHPSRSHPWRSRRIAGLPAGRGQPDLSRSKKEAMRADFSTESGKVLEVVSTVAPPPSDSVAYSTLRLGGARGVLSYLCSGCPIQYIHGSRMYSLLECTRVELLMSADVC
jgi:hypothetical protein